MRLKKYGYGMRNKAGALGDRFLFALDACFEDLIRSPLQQMRKEPFRYMSINGFPSYRLVFAVDGEAITVYQIRHTSRIPHRTSGP